MAQQQAAPAVPRFGRDDIVMYRGPRLRYESWLFYIRSVVCGGDDPVYELYEEVWGVKLRALQSDLRGPNDKI